MPILVHEYIKRSTIAAVFGFNILEVCIGAIWILREIVLSKHTKHEAFDRRAIAVGGGA